MATGQAEEIVAMALVFAVHVAGAVLLVWALLDAEQRGRWRRGGEPGDDGDGGGGGGGGGWPKAPPPSGPDRHDERRRRPLPLSDSAPSRVRLREPVRLAGGYRRVTRRPAHGTESPPAPRRLPSA
ncbi:MAG: hypothetical protein Q8O56_09270 [Solirubrobacteraceae bacterium]|nr:hypothetical protein [Solirubrobacteraceae bacterium]